MTSIKKYLPIAAIFLLAACTPPATTTTDAANYTALEVSSHNSSNDCWVIINGEVYDVTDYVKSHPGGVAEIVRGCGIDATSLFNARPSEGNTPHPPSASRILENYKIGSLAK